MKIECRVSWRSPHLNSYTNWLDEQGVVCMARMDLQNKCDIIEMDELDAIIFKLKFGL